VTEPRPSEVRKALQDMQKPQLLLRNARDLLRTLVVTDDRRAQQLLLAASRAHAAISCAAPSS
jgi:hypothetical protein